MNNIIKNDLYRFSKSILLYVILSLTIVISFSLTMMIRQDIRLGISVFGNLTAFRGIDDIIRIGILYQRGLGFFIAILLSVLIGQEYQWKTWQHKWIANKSRAGIYLSKAVLSSAISAAVFLIFQIVVLLSSSQIENILTAGYTAMVISGAFVYAALGAVVCLLSMLIKNNITSIIACICYVMYYAVKGVIGEA